MSSNLEQFTTDEPIFSRPINSRSAMEILAAFVVLTFFNCWSLLRLAVTSVWHREIQRQVGTLRRPNYRFLVCFLRRESCMSIQWPCVHTGLCMVCLPAGSLHLRALIWRQTFCSCSFALPLTCLCCFLCLLIIDKAHDSYVFRMQASDGREVHNVRGARAYYTDVGKRPIGGGLELWQGLFQLVFRSDQRIRRWTYTQERSSFPRPHAHQCWHFHSNNVGCWILLCYDLPLIASWGTGAVTFRRSPWNFWT